MKPHVQRASKPSPYSAPLCVLMLLLAGMLIKFGPTLHFVHMAGNEGNGQFDAKLRDLTRLLGQSIPVGLHIYAIPIKTR